MFTTHTRVPHLHTMSTTQQNKLRQAIDGEASLPIHDDGSDIIQVSSVSHSRSHYIFLQLYHSAALCIKTNFVTCLMPMSALCPGRHAFGSSHHKLWKQRRATLTGRTLRTKARGGCGTPRVHGGGERDAAPGPRTRGC